MHDDATGEPRVSLRAAGWVLAAALLGELLYSNRVWIKDDVIFPVWQAAPPDDVVSHAVLDQVKAESVRHPVRDWLAFLSGDAYGRVAGRLAGAGLVMARTSGVWPFRSVRFVPVDVKVSAWPFARLAAGLRHRQPLTQTDVFLTGLAQAAGLDEWLIRDAMHPDWTREYLRYLVSTLPEQQHLLLAHLKAAVANDLVSHRT
ncbi:GPP34 family phosphoprotein [Micromonospora sp. CPCC 205371]|nr:GPP34 family phosphoprotein [Micromonospora sp. CPCC 205371]